MYVITVEFLIRQQYLTQFLTAMHAQANNSLTLEPECHQFDVAVSENNPCSIFLYELYTDKAAFEQHLASDHFAGFNQLVADWVADKKVSGWHRPE